MPNSQDRICNIPLPSLEEQKEIVERLEKAKKKRDEAIAKAHTEFNETLEKEMGNKKFLDS